MAIKQTIEIPFSIGDTVYFVDTTDSDKAGHRDVFHGIVRQIIVEQSKFKKNDTLIHIEVDRPFKNRWGQNDSDIWEFRIPFGFEQLYETEEAALAAAKAFDEEAFRKNILSAVTKW